MSLARCKSQVFDCSQYSQVALSPQKNNRDKKFYGIGYGKQRIIASYFSQLLHGYIFWNLIKYLDANIYEFRHEKTLYVSATKKCVIFLILISPDVFSFVWLQKCHFIVVLTCSLLWISDSGLKLVQVLENIFKRRINWQYCNRWC